MDDNVNFKIRSRGLNVNQDSPKRGLKNQPRHHVDERKNIPGPYRDMAKAMEKQFVEMMLQQMKKSSQGADKDSTGMDYYKGLLTTEQSDMMAKLGRGLGIQDMILDQVYPKAQRTPEGMRLYKTAMEMNRRGSPSVKMKDQEVSND